MKQLRHQLPFCLIVATIIALWTFTAAVRTSEARASFRQHLSAERADAVRYAEQVSRLETLQAETRRLNSRADMLTSNMVSPDEGDSLVARVRQLAELNTLSTEPVRTLSSAQDAGLTVRTLQINLRGGFNGFYAYLLQLETLSPSIAVIDMKLNREETGAAELSAELTLQLMLRSDRSAVAGAGGGK